nr:hypothetical protein [Tanacetum cinerariifolium]
MTAIAAGKAAAVAAVVVAVVLGVDGDGVNGCCDGWYRDGEGGGAARCGCGGVVSAVECGGPSSSSSIFFLLSSYDLHVMEMIRLSCGIKSQASSESRPPMLNKENYVPWSSRLLRYAKSRPNGKLIHKSILNGPYVRKMIPEPGDANREITVTKTFHLQKDDELSDKE